jgi:hypothetical protein
MHEDYNDLDSMIEDEPWDESWDETLEPHDDYGIKFNDKYNIELSEPDIVIQRMQENHGESDIKSPVITELRSDIEIIKILPIDQPKILSYLDEK